MDGRPYRQNSQYLKIIKTFKIGEVTPGSPVEENHFPLNVVAKHRGLWSP